jgi:hypothetical protein
VQVIYSNGFERVSRVFADSQQVKAGDLRRQRSACPDAPLSCGTRDQHPRPGMTWHVTELIWRATAAGTVIPHSTVLVGQLPHVLRTATDADRARLAGPRGCQVALTDHPGTTIPPHPWQEH